MPGTTGLTHKTTAATKLARSAFQRLLCFEGSTRAIGLVRIGLVFLLWSKYSNYLLPFRAIPYQQIFVGVSFFSASILVLLGIWTRLATAWLGLTMIVIYYYVGYHLGEEPLTHHHTYLVSVTAVLLALTPCGRSFSLDRWLAIRKATKGHSQIPPERGPLWATYLIAFQLTMAYFWSAVDKLKLGFFTGERLQQIFMYYYIGSDFPPGVWFPVVTRLLAVATIILELVLAVGLWIPKIQKQLMVLGIAFHLLLYYCLPVSTFSLTVCLIYLVYLPPEEVHDFVDRLLVSPAQEGGETVSSPRIGVS